MMRAKPWAAIVDVAGSGCATVAFAIHAFNEWHAVEVIARRRTGSKAPCADSESRFLAIKKFSRSPASRLIVARQNRFFARIERGRFAGRFVARARCFAVYGE